MESENQHSESQPQQIEVDIVPLQDKYDKVLTLNSEVRAEIQQITRNAIKKPLLNCHIDPRNEAHSYSLSIMRQNLQFKHFMTKKKNESKKKQAFQIIREMLQERGFDNISTINNRQAKSVMVVRFVYKFDNRTNQTNIMEIEDQISKQRQKIIVKQGVVWIGLICAIQAVYENQMYRLDKIIDLSPQASKRNAPSIPVNLNTPLNAYRVLMIKGPFWKTDGNQNVGIQLLVNQIQTLRYQQNTRVDLLIVMGPILSQHNLNVVNSTLQNTFEDQALNIIQTLKKRIEKIVPNIQILMIPSTDDVTSLYPMPQPAYDLRPKCQVKFGSNPCTIRLQSGKTECKLNLINYDLIKYIDSSKCSKSEKQLLIQIIQTYLKQPFLITNTLDDAAFDQTNFNCLFNRCDFGNIIVMSSQKHPPFAHKVKGNKIFINIGSLGIDSHTENKSFMTLMSIYEGQGQVADRVKVQSIIM